MNSKKMNDEVKNIGKLMSLESKFNVVGSANVKEIYIIQIMSYLIIF